MKALWDNEGHNTLPRKRYASFTIVMEDGFQNLLQTLDKRYAVPSYTYFSHDGLQDLYAEWRQKVETEMEELWSVKPQRPIRGQAGWLSHTYRKSHSTLHKWTVAACKGHTSLLTTQERILPMDYERVCLAGVCRKRARRSSTLIMDQTLSKLWN